MSSNLNCDASSRKVIKINDASSWSIIKNWGDGGGVHWSDLDHDVLLLVMMRLGVVDYLAFSGVCKTWRSLAHANRKRFMASIPPMFISIPTVANEEECYCYLEDFEGRRFKTMIPESVGRKCVGLTCGYLILFGRKTRDFWLVNPITRHQLHFPDFPCPHYLDIKAILVFSRSRSAWLLAVAERIVDRMWFSIAGEGAWNPVSTTSFILDLHAFKGKIYSLNVGCRISGVVEHLCEMRLGPEPELMLLKTNNFPVTTSLSSFVISGENLYVVEYISDGRYKVHELDFCEMEWLYHEKTKEKYAFFKNCMGHITAVKWELWAGTDKSHRDRVNTAKMWYFPHECLNVNLIDE